MLILISLFFFVTVLLKNLTLTKFTKENNVVDLNYDIINPSFTINSDNQKIAIKASKGNFLSNDLILLEKNVSFESTKFKIFSDRVIFDRKKQTAQSKSNSKFESKGTKINSEGFSIIQQGNIILFNGKTSLVLEQ